MNKNEIRVIFMGTPAIAKTVLKGLVEDGYNVVLVVTNPDKITGRKAILTPSEVKEYALEKGIEVFQPISIKTDYQKIVSANADVLVTCAYGQIVPLEVLNAPKKGCINVHGSLLPHLRGASPIQSALFEGLTETGVTIMEMVSKMDAGKMYKKEIVKIEETDNYTSLYNKIAEAGTKALLSMLPSYLDGTIAGEEQDESLVTFCKKITSEDEHLSLDFDVKEFVNKVKGLSYTPGGFVYYDNKKLKILRCSYFSNEILKEKGYFIKLNKSTLLLQLANGLIKIEEVQKENKNRIDAKSFMNGERNLENIQAK